MQRYDIITHNNRSHEVPLRPAPGPRICMCAFACQLCEANALWNLAVSMRSLRCMSHIHKSCARDCRHMCTSSWYRCFMVREHARVRPSHMSITASTCAGHRFAPELAPSLHDNHTKRCVFLGGGLGEVRTPPQPFSPSGRNSPTAAVTCCYVSRVSS